MKNKDHIKAENENNQHTRTGKLYSDEISLTASEEISDYVLLNLRKIADYRQKFDIPVIGIAGTEGKTTTKRMLASILSLKGNVLETPLDCTTTHGVTATLLKLNEDYLYAILELGILNQKQFELAVKVSQPTIAVITNIGEAHLSTLGDKYLIADAKVELVRHLPEDGTAILNMDDDLVSEMEKFSTAKRVLKFGLNPNAHFFANRLRYQGPQGISFQVNDYYEFHLPIYSSAFVYNALAAISVARLLNFSFDEIKQGLEERFSILEHRGNLIQIKSINILDYSYDATINSIIKSCEALVQFKSYSDKLILVIGNINNPGPDPMQTHLNFGYYLSALPIDTVITYGELAKFVGQGISEINHTNKKLITTQKPQELISVVQDQLSDNSTLLVTGAKKLGMDLILQNLLQKIST